MHSPGRLRLLRLLGILALCFTPFLGPGTVRADGNGALGQSTIRTQTGNYTAAGTGMCPSTCTGAGTIVIGDVPAGSTATDAFLYWNVVSSTAPAGTSSGTINGVSVTGALIGSGTTASGTPLRIGVYRAPVPVSVVAAGNGAYVLAGFPSGSATFAQGAQLVLLYSNASLPSTTIVINDGLVIIGSGSTPEPSSASTTLSGFPAIGAGAAARTTFVVADATSASTDTALFNGVPLGANPFRSTSGQFWDSFTANVTGVNPPSATSVTATVTNGGPVYLFWLAQVYSVSAVPATPTPTPPPIPEADTLLLFGGGLTGLFGYAAFQFRRLRR